MPLTTHGQKRTFGPPEGLVSASSASLTAVPASTPLAKTALIMAPGVIGESPVPTITPVPVHPAL